MTTPAMPHRSLLVDTSPIEQKATKRAIIEFCNCNSGLLRSPKAEDFRLLSLWLELGFSDHELRDSSGLMPDLGLAWVAIYEDDYPDSPLLKLDADCFDAQKLETLGLGALRKMIARRALECVPALELWKNSKTLRRSTRKPTPSRIAAR